MDQKKPKSDTPETVPKVDLLDKEPIAVAMEGVSVPTAGGAVKRRANKYTIITIILVVIALLVVLFQLEKQGRVGTNVFGPMIAALEANKPVAVVNGEKITSEDVEGSIGQLRQTAAAQGLNPNDPAVQAEIQNQAVDMLVNTTLLEQAAVQREIEVSDVAVEERIAELANAAGGMEALAERLAEFDIDQDQLFADVKDELTIRLLLDEVFGEAELQVTEAEVTELYQNAVDINTGEPLPPLSEVYQQIEDQLYQNKEQEALDAYLQDLRADADIELQG